ncbi:peptide deformylase [Patescibacteria group bacterium]|nr:peptide deformylase [Patescibacteria group bacterium]MBU1472609.1 peptide deformylase [Patescibacteria group bacterium]MBU2459860.1 peptide deformylase [Patescibacteria group bacterium]MBU2544079.1 peptide deformylase [Patescibacteria group bacterium]
MDIVSVPNQALTTPAQAVKSFDKRLVKLIDWMKRTLIAAKNPRGVGLAAPQIGELYRIFITRPAEKSKIRIFINPEIIKKSDDVTDGLPAQTGVPERENWLEGCLSIPKIWGRVKRAASVTLRYRDETGKQHEEEFTGFLATIIQHETDHVNGVLFTKRVLERKGKLYQPVVTDDGKEILEEIQLK